MVTKIAIFSIMFGLAILIISFNVLNGFNKGIQEKIFRFYGHIHITKYNSGNELEQPALALNTNLYNTWKTNYPEIEHLYSFISKPALMRSNEGIQGVIVKALGEDYPTNVFKKQLIEGSFFSFNDTTSNYEISISSVMANKMRIKLGDEVTLFFVQQPPRYRKLKVTSIYHSGMEEFDQLYVFTELNVLQKINGWTKDEVGGYEVLLKDFSKLEENTLSIYDKMDNNLSLAKVNDEFIQLFDWFDLLKNNVNLLMVIILIVVCLNIVSSFVIIILDKTSTIGLLKSIGATNKQIQNVFFYNGLRILFKGLILGNFLAIGFSFLQDKYKLIPLDAQNYYIESVPISWQWKELFYVNIICILLVVLALYIPTHLVAKINPTKALRFK